MGKRNIKLFRARVTEINGNRYLENITYNKRSKKVGLIWVECFLFFHCFDLCFFVCCIDVLVKLHYIFSSSCSSGSSSKGDSEDYTKRRSGFDICPFFLFALLHALRKNSV